MSRHPDDEILIVVEVPHQGSPQAYESTLGRLCRRAAEACDADEIDDVSQCADILGRDLHAIDVWQESDAAQLAAQEPTAQRHGDPSRTMAAQAIARRLGWIATREEASR